MDTIYITIPPDGRTLPFRVLPIGSTWVPQRWLPRLWARLSGYERGSFYFLGLIERFQDGDLGALRRLLKEFPAAARQPALRSGLWARLSGYERGSFYFLGLIERFQDGDLGALRRLLKEFPAAVHQPALCYLMPIELVKAAGDFFGAVRPLRQIG